MLSYAESFVFQQVAKQVSKGKNAKRWKHDSLILIEGHVNYTTLVSYVNSIWTRENQLQLNALF